MSAPDAAHHDEHHRKPDAMETPAPEPTELPLFLPWAVRQLQLDIELEVHTSVLEDYVSVAASGQRHRGASKGKSRAKLHSSDLALEPEVNKTVESRSQDTTELSFEKRLSLTAVYENRHVVEIKFEKNRRIPCEIIKIIALIVRFHKNLTTISINRGLNIVVMHELAKLICLSRITNICLDNCFVAEGNYYILLEQQTCLKNLSLCRCSIDDTVVGLVASQLAYPHPGSSSLVVLNLSTNRITDIGMKSIAVALRTNDKLAYLNLADNMISDVGLGYLLSNLIEFPLTNEEMITSRAKRKTYTLSKKDAIENFMQELKTSDLDKKQLLKKRKLAFSRQNGNKKSKILDKESSDLENEKPFDSVLYERAGVMAAIKLGPFRGPFNDDNVVKRDGWVFSMGNNTLNYLNMAYNNLSYISVWKLLEVLRYQRKVGRRPVGLMNMCLEGNPMPRHCEELVLIDSILDAGLGSLSRRSGTTAHSKNKKMSSISRNLTKGAESAISAI